MRVQQEEALPEVLIDQVHPMERRRLPAREALAHLRRDPVGADAEPRAHRPHELQVRAIGGVHDHRAVGGHAAVGREVAGQPAVEVRHRLVQRRQLLEEPGQVVDQQVLPGGGRHAVGEPLEHREVLGRAQQRHAAGAAPGAVAVGEPVRDPERRGRRLGDPGARELGRQPVPGLERRGQDLALLALVLAGPHEPPVALGCEELLGLPVARDRDLDQRLHAVRREGGVRPPAVGAQHPMDATGQVLDLAGSLPRQHPGLPRQAVEKSTTGGHVERRGLLVVEGTQALQRAAAGVAEGDVRRHDVVDLGLLAHLCDVVLADASCHVSESTGRRGQGGRRSGGRSYPEGW